jgi:hypothetical protein
LRGGYGVVHQFAAEDKVFLLAGGGIIANEQIVLVPVMDDIDNAKFTGAFVLSADNAWAAVREFLRHGSAEDLAHWQEMQDRPGRSVSRIHRDFGAHYLSQLGSEIWPPQCPCARLRANRGPEAALRPSSMPAAAPARLAVPYSRA